MWEFDIQKIEITIYMNYRDAKDIAVLRNFDKTDNGCDIILEAPL